MKRALLVGIDHYDGFGSLDGCVNDVNALEALLSRNEDNSPNFDCQKRTSLTGGVTRDELLGDLDGLLDAAADVALLYFAGHGAGTGTDVALVTRDGTPATPGIAFSEILAKVAGSGVREVILILDCCFSGAAGGIPQLASSATTLRDGVSILAASRGDQVAEETDGGIFSNFLGGALDGGAADVDRQGDDRGAVLVSGRVLRCLESAPRVQGERQPPARAPALHAGRPADGAQADLRAVPGRGPPVRARSLLRAVGRAARPRARARLLDPPEVSGGQAGQAGGRGPHVLRRDGGQGVPAHAPRQALLAGRQGGQAVTALGVTGHQTLPPRTREFVVAAVQGILRQVEPPLDVITSLAAGADQLVASELLRIGGRLHVIVPCRGYERTFAAEEDLAAFRSLLERAHDVTRLDHAEPSEEAFLAAGESVVNNCEMVIAVWDGEPARGRGGTADIVRYARDTGKAVRIVWPEDVAR